MCQARAGGILDLCEAVYRPDGSVTKRVDAVPSRQHGGRSIVSDRIRECGACTACCTVIGVPELEKGTYEVCEHLCHAGCGIYADRPRSCRTFECQWLRGVLEVDGSIDPALRPDSCGLIFDYQPESAFGEAFVAWEVEPGASAGGRAKSILDGLAERFLVMIVTRGPDNGKGRSSRRFVGPPHMVRQAADVMWSRGGDPGGEP